MNDSDKIFKPLKIRGMKAKAEGKDMVVPAEILPPACKVVLERGHKKGVYVGAIPPSLIEIAKEYGFVILSASYEDQTYLMRYVG